MKIEITESALIEAVNQPRKIAKELKAMGCKLALDDFGTGASSLRHLQALPFDELKIDRSFVESMTSRRESRKIVAAIIGLGQSLGLTTVAEGVETEEQAEMMLRLGCGLGQGWLYGRPVLADKLPAAVEMKRNPIATGKRGRGATVSSLEAMPTQRFAQLQAIYDGVPVGLCFLDTSFRYVSMNERLATMNGHSVEAHIGRTMKEIFPEWYPKYEPYVLRAMQGEALGGVEFVLPGRNPGDADRVTLASYQPAWDEAEEVIGVSIALLDITEHMRVEKALRESKTDQPHRVEVNALVPWTMDRNGKDLHGDLRWLQTTRLSKEGIRNLRWLETIHSDDLVAATQIMKAALRTGAPIDMEYRVRGPDEEWRWVRSQGSPRFGPEGEITRWFGSVVDIDQRKQIEEALAASEAQVLAIFDAVPVGFIVADAVNRRK